MNDKSILLNPFIHAVPNRVSNRHAHHFVLVTKDMLRYGSTVARVPIPVEIKSVLLRTCTQFCTAYSVSTVLCTILRTLRSSMLLGQRDIIPGHLVPQLFSFRPVRRLHPDEEALMTKTFFMD